MSSCKHTSWLDFSYTNELVLWDTGRLSRLSLELTNPARQRPSLILFVGRKCKEFALRDLFPWNNIKKSSREGFATLRADTLSLHSDFPIFFAESDPFTTPLHPEAYACHEASSSPLQWSLSAGQSLYDVVHARLFSLFTDILCIFADDFYDFEDVVSRIRAWAALGRASGQFHMARLKVIIVKQGAGPGPSPTYDLLESEYLQHNLSQPDIVAFFSSVTVLHLADEQISSLARHRPLKELIQRQTDEIRHVKQSIGCHLSALHLTWYFSEAVKHTARTVVESFDYMALSRHANPISTEFSEHLINFLSLRTQCDLPENIWTSYLASVILVDAYPRGMHCKSTANTFSFAVLTETVFDPEIVYDHIYKPLCVQSLVASSKTQSLVPHQNQAIRDSLADQFSVMQISGETADTIHRSTFGSINIPWEKFQSNQTCLPCLRRKPEHVLSCGHSVCDTCVRIFGCPVLGSEYTYELKSCPLCSSGWLTVALKPPTAGVRILSIDGGGIRGVVPLEFLGILQNVVGPDCPIRDLFDLAFGTSSGELSLGHGMIFIDSF